jgi:hypothetical protein
MSFSDLLVDLDLSIRARLCDPVELRPKAGEAPRVIPAMIATPVEPTGNGFGATMLQASIQVHIDDAILKEGDVAVPGAWVGEVFVAGDRGFRVAGAPTRDTDGMWQTAPVERYKP